VSRATVYRTLSMLEEAGFVASLDTGENGRRFEHVLGHDQHDHMVCEECGRIVEFVEPELERMREAVARKHGFRIVSQTLKLLVACDDPDCEHRRGGSTPS
jgi:Fur family ferric uptake transcriptional regulator